PVTRRPPQRPAHRPRHRRPLTRPPDAPREDPRVIDWIIAKRIATFVAGTGEARAPTADLTELAAESESRVVAYTGLKPAKPLPPPEGFTRQEWVATNIDSMRLLLDPVLTRAGENLG